MQHVTVLLHEAVAGLALTPDATVVDATFGAGGHSRAILHALGAQGKLIAIDADPAAITSAQLPAHSAHVELINDSFSNLSEILRSLHIDSVNAILTDLGWRMEQFSAGGRGFSFRSDEPLLMTYGNPSNYPFTAYDIINEWDESVIADIIYGYGQERLARRIARAIVNERAKGPISTAQALAELVVNVYPPRARHQRIHPATRTFQALRIAVHDELGVLERFIPTAVDCLAVGGRLAIITFHSLEDRVVKHAFRAQVDSGRAALITKRPIEPTAAEVAKNPRARSAKLRIISKT